MLIDNQQYYKLEISATICVILVIEVALRIDVVINGKEERQKHDNNKCVYDDALILTIS